LFSEKSSKEKNKKKKEITEGKIYSPVGRFAERAKLLQYRAAIGLFILAHSANLPEVLYILLALISSLFYSVQS